MPFGGPAAGGLAPVGRVPVEFPIGGVVTEGIVTPGTVMEGVLTGGVVTDGTVMEGTVIPGTVMEGTVTDGGPAADDVSRPAAVGGSANRVPEIATPRVPASSERHPISDPQRPAHIRPTTLVRILGRFV